MNYEEYRKHALATALDSAKNYPYLVYGLIAEIGEVLGKVAKSIRDEWEMERIDAELTAELGDVCWFTAVLEAELERDGVLGMLALPLDLENAAPTVEGELVALAGALSSAYDEVVLTESEAAKSKLLGQVYQLRDWLSENADVVCNTGIEQVREGNVAKLQGRQLAGALQGSGDYR